MSLPVIRRREFGAKRERPWWDSNPQPLNGFSYPCLEVQCAIHCATEPPTIYQIDLYVFNLERIRSLFGPSALVACLTLRTQSDIDFAR